MTEPPTNPVPIHAEDPDDDWVTATNTGRAVRVRMMTGGLVILAVLAGGFWGGVVAEKHHGSGSNATTTAAGRFGAAARAAAAAAGGFTLGGAGGNFTTGTLIDVQGNELDISDSSGNIVKVKVGSSTTVTRTAKSSLSGLQIGDTVIVTGSAGSGGTVSATAVRATAQGTPAGGGGGGGGGFGGGAAAGG